MAESRGFDERESAVGNIASQSGMNRESIRELIQDIVLQVMMTVNASTVGISARQSSEWYDIPALAKLVDRNPFTVREWCRHGRLNAKKKRSGRGRSCEWVVSHQELQRYLREGLLPPARHGA
ncbi:MerR family transcriptional regulator [Zavarzinella formosa]|uniref:helix-turn-helix domain-containing protein n=1 Tax=Zavarzinella formosa TaxID=360055 RepID=UPI0019309E8D|nr:helix-turn-helix domain-containing protein [Zavarzinella formosa]